jgi:hypothetical protein
MGPNWGASRAPTHLKGDLAPGRRSTFTRDENRKSSVVECSEDVPRPFTCAAGRTGLAVLTVCVDLGLAFEQAQIFGRGLSNLDF